jgi:hypothetical protein
MISRIVVALPAVVLLAGMCASPLPAAAQAPTVPDAAVDLVRVTVAKEVAAANDSSAKYMFRASKKTPQGSQNRIYVETREAIAGMTTAYNDKPLTPEQMQGEKGRLAGLVGNPELLQRKQRQEKEEAEHTLRIVRALPDAFLYQYDGSEVGTQNLGSEGRKLVRLKFRPNPTYRPPSHVEDVLVGMQGYLLIDPSAHRIARIDGTLFKEVTFGWGILGHLNRGGHFVVQQQDVGDGSWEISCMRLEFTGKILLFKSLAIKTEEEFSGFRRVPPGTTFPEGVKMLQEEGSKPPISGSETARAERKTRSH